MREILFRGKHKGNGQWVFGDLLQIPGKDYCSIMEQAACAANVEVIPETVGQFTGLTDKNGKKIFEGDIVTISSAAVCMTGVIEFHDCGFEVREEDVYECLWYDPDELEIIDNIHDNPELLGGTDNA